MRAVILVLLVAALPWSAAAADAAISLTIANDGARPIDCQIIFGHWVTGEPVTIAPGGSAGMSLRRQERDGALFVPRYDDRKMMVENIDCSERGNWLATLGQVPLLPIREATPRDYRAVCRVGGGGVSCSRPVGVE